MAPSHLKISIDGRQTANFLLLLDLTVEHALNRHSTCSFFMRQPPSARHFYEPDPGKPVEIAAVGQGGAERELLRV